MPGQHIYLCVESSNDELEREPVHVEPLGSSRYRILYTPGLVYGVAAGDEIELLNDDGAFRVLRHGGNIAVRVLSADLTQVDTDALIEEISNKLHGTLDGRASSGMSFTIPVRVGFAAIEAVFKHFVAAHPLAIWEYGNVYDNQSRPLNWWVNNDA